MVRTWGLVVWIFVTAMAIAVVVQALLTREASGTSPAAPGLRLNEILAGPARDWDGDGVYDAKGDEWVEVQNTGALEVVLDDFRLADADKVVRVALTGSLAPGAVRLVTGSEAVAWQTSHGLATSGLSLNNSGDTVHLLWIAGTDTTTVDLHSYGGIEGGSDRSVGRAGSLSEDWILFDALNPYTGSGTPAGTGCAPTPGGVNGCSLDVKSTTWGAIKRLYR